MVDALWVHPGRDHATSQKGFDFRGPQQPTVHFRVVKRYDTSAIAAQNQSIPGPVPQTDGILPLGVVEHGRAIVFIKVDPAFGVALCLKRVAPSLQISLKFRVIEQFAVECDPGLTVLIAQWLATAGQVDNRKPSGAQGHPRFEVKRFVVWPAMGNRVGHSCQNFARKFTLAIQV